jgi:dTDP-3-amino-3,4,6-trideoxy-alpha-D-glucose transaminase
LNARVPFIDLRAGHREIRTELQAAVAGVVDSGWYLLGPELEAFEREFDDYCGTAHCVGVGSGLSAIELALSAAGIGAGDEVIVPAYTWIATWLAVSRAGARPVPVDAAVGSWNIDPEKLPAAIGERTAAIVPVHLRGQPADMQAINEIASARGVLVVEDAAQAHGARVRGRRAGSLGAAAAFSFYPTKNLGALGDAGAVVTDDPDLAARVRGLRNYGLRNRYEIETAGVNSRLAELQAAVLRVKLPHLDDWNDARRQLAAGYTGAFGTQLALRLPEVPDWADPVWHLFVICHPDRDACVAALDADSIEALVHYPVLPHLSPPYRDHGWTKGSLPVAEELARTVVSLPMYPQLDRESCGRVSEAVLATLEGKSQ